MAYESIDRLKKYIQKKINALVTGEKVTFNINAHKLFDELNEMDRKTKGFDKVKKFVSKKLDDDVRHYHRFKSERDNGELAAYERIDDIIQEHMEDE